MRMHFIDITEKFNTVEPNKEYWFIRTSKGKNFNAFTSRGYIGIGWNYITTQDLRNSTDVQIKDKIARLYEENSTVIGLNPNTRHGKSKITAIYNKIRRFESLKEGDLVVVPNKGSQFIAFGYIADSQIYNDFEDSNCDFHKRRKVNWIETKALTELDPIFYKIIFSKHAISNINSYAGFIDKIVSSVFIKDDKSHLVLDVKTKENIPIKELSGLITSVQSLTSLINDEFDFEDDLSNNAIKLNLQSPGNVEFIYKRGKSLLVLSLILSLPINIGCSNTEASVTSNPNEIAREKAENIQIINDTLDRKTEISQQDKDSLKNFVETNYQIIADAKKQIDTLEINVEKLNSIN